MIRRFCEIRNNLNFPQFLQFEKEKLDKQIKKLETDKDSMSAERDALASEKEKLTAEFETSQKSVEEEKEKTIKIMAEKDNLSKQLTKVFVHRFMQL